MIGGCGTAPPITPPPDPGVITVADIQQSDAPVLWPLRDGFVAAWTGADDAGVHQDARRYRSGTLEPVVVLPLPPRHPFRQRSAPAANGNLHLLWLDAGDDGNNRLYSALLSPGLEVERGPTPVSDRLTLHYTLAPEPNGGVWVAWSGGLLAEPAISVQFIDNDGRPRAAQPAISNADWPTLLRINNGAMRLYWLEGTGNQLARGTRVEGVVENRAVITAGVRLRPGDRMNGLQAASDGRRDYVFWSITRADGTDETWVASGGPDADEWEQPTLLTIILSSADGNNSASAMPRLPAAWGTPLPGEHNPLPLLAQVENDLVILTLRDGNITETKPVTTLGAGLVGLPALYEDADGGLLAAWAEPTRDGTAALNVSKVETRPGAT